MSDIEDQSAAVAVRSTSAATKLARVGGRAGAVERRPADGAVADTKLRALEGPPSWSGAAQHAQLLLAMRRQRKSRFLMSFAGFVLLPTLATIAYFVFIATPRYSSEFEFTYQTYRPPASLASGLVESVTGTSQTNTVDIGTIVYEYIRSPSLMEKLDKDLGLRKAYSDPKIDYLSRLRTDASRESFLNYFRSYVTVTQGLGGYLTVSVLAFDPDYAQKLAKAVFVACDEMIDSISQRARNDQLHLAEDELTRQEDRVRRARQAMTEFQTAHGDLDPQHKAEQLGQIVGSIESDLAVARAQLADAIPALNANSPIVVELKSKIASLEQQLQHQQTRLAGSGNASSYSLMLNQYQALQLEQDFAKNAYLQAQQGLVVARADAAGKRNYLVDFAPAMLPQRANLAVPLQYILSVFLGSLVFFGFFSILTGAFQDQIDF